jgi:ribosomal protein S12 methylthiotransferase accessory factor
MKLLQSPTQSFCDVVDCLVDEHVGIIRRVQELPRAAGAPDLFCFYAEACEMSALTGHQYAGIPGGGGASIERETALAKAIGEAVERYCGTMYHHQDFPLASFDSAPFPCVPPGEFALYSQEQYAQTGFPYVPFDTSTPIRWTPALDLMSGETCYVPAVKVFLSYFYENKELEKPIAQSMSTGLACHVSPIQAAISAICEVIERDAFTITWQAKLARPQIRLETLNDRDRDLVGRFTRTGSDVTLFYLKMDHSIPTILAALRSKAPEAPALVFAAAADLDPERAVHRSLEELAHTRLLAQWIKHQLPRLVPDSRYRNVVSLHDHANLYCDTRHAKLADFLFSVEEEIGFHEIEGTSSGNPDSDLKSLCGEVWATNNRVLLADVTSDDVRDIGLSVIRAVVPGFHPLIFGHRIRALGGSRLWEVPQKLGYQGITRETGDNPAPHPFP